MPRKRLTGRLLLTMLVLVWGYDLLTNARPFWNAEDVRPYQQFLTTHWAMPLWSRSDEPVRYLEVGNELSNRALTLSDFKQRRLIGSASGYHPVAYEKYYELSGRLGFYNPNFLRLFAVNYLLWPEASKEPWPEGFQEYKRAEGKILLRNPDNAYVRPVTHLRTVRDWKDLLNRLATPGFNTYESTLILESDVKPELRGKQATPADMHLQTRIFPIGPGETRLRCQALKAGTIVVSEPAVPGWHVWINGAFMPHQPARADGYFLLLYLLAGKSDILLVYDPVSQRLGLYVTLLTLGAWAFFKGRSKAKANEYSR